jgi:hypothetical protein
LGRNVSKCPDTGARKRRTDYILWNEM